jgi:hypothetical protein
MNEPKPNDDGLAELAALPTRDVDPWRAARIRHHALAELERTEPEWLGKARAFYERILEPVAVAGVTLAYLGWAVASVSALYGS